MTYEQFLKLNKSYRICCDWDDTLTKCNKESAFIIADNFRTIIYWKDNDTFGVLNYGKERYSSQLDKLKVEYEMDDDGYENVYFIDFKYFEKCIKVFNPKKSPSNSVSPFSVKNINNYLRFMRNIDKEYYGKKLEQNIGGNSEEK